MNDTSYMTVEQELAYLVALIRMKRIACGIDPNTCQRRDDWNEPEPNGLATECRGAK